MGGGASPRCLCLFTFRVINISHSFLSENLIMLFLFYKCNIYVLTFCKVLSTR